MRPLILIIEPRREIAEALNDLLASNRFLTVVMPYVDRLEDLDVTPDAVLVRVTFEGISEPAHAAVARMPANRPPVVAIVSAADEHTEALRLNCNAVLRAPKEIGRLCEVLGTLVQQCAQR